MAELPQRPSEWACIPFVATDPRGNRVQVIPVEFVDYVWALWAYASELRKEASNQEKNRDAQG